VSTLSGRRICQAAVPLGQEEAELVAQREEFFDAPIQILEPLADKLTNALTGHFALVAHRQHAPQIPERESNRQGSLDQQHPIDGSG
jgi:hypothetical protein